MNILLPREARTFGAGCPRLGSWFASWFGWWNSQRWASQKDWTGAAPWFQVVGLFGIVLNWIGATVYCDAADDPEPDCTGHWTHKQTIGYAKLVFVLCFDCIRRLSEWFVKPDSAGLQDHVLGSSRAFQASAQKYWHFSHTSSNVRITFSKPWAMKGSLQASLLTNPILAPFLLAGQRLLDFVSYLFRKPSNLRRIQHPSKRSMDTREIACWCRWVCVQFVGTRWK